jgi:hypothetical protein
MQPFKAICLAAVVDAIKLDDTKDSSFATIMAEAQQEQYTMWWKN